MIIDTHYDVLNVTPDAPGYVIRAAYLALARKYHPDRNLTNAEAMRMMQLINIAYQVLSDPQEKAAHDHFIRQHNPDAIPPHVVTVTLNEKTKAELAAWDALVAKEEGEAKAARNRADKAAEKAASCPPGEKQKWQSWADHAAQEAREADARLAKAVAEAKAASAKIYAKSNPFKLDEGKGHTHYSVLKLTSTAPVEVVKAVYKALLEEIGDAAETKPIVQALTAAHSVLCDPESKQKYDATIAPAAETFNKRETNGTAYQAGREKEAAEKAAKARTLADAAAALAERAQEEAKECREKAQAAAEDAQKRSKDADHAKWAAWAARLSDDAAAADKRAEKAQADARQARARHAEAEAEARAEADRAARYAASDAETLARNRAIREAAEKAEREKQA